MKAERAAAGGPPASSPDRARDRRSRAAAAPAWRARPRAAGLGCSPGAASAWGAESGSPGTHGAANSDNSEARGELIHRARPHGCARRGCGEWEERCLSPLGGGSRARSAGGERGAPLRPEPRGRAPAAGRGAAAPCKCAGAGARAPPSPRSQRHTTRLLPSLCLPCPPLPSDSTALKANGEGASFKVHINLVLVGYTLAAASAVPKGVVPTAHSEPFLAASRPAYAGSRSERARVVRRCVGLRVCCPLENSACFAASRQVTVV